LKLYSAVRINWPIGYQQPQVSSNSRPMGRAVVRFPQKSHFPQNRNRVLYAAASRHLKRDIGPTRSHVKTL